MKLLFKKAMIPFTLLLVLILSACTSNEGQSTESTNETSETITYQSENGPVEVPSDPQRVIVLSSFAGNVMALDVN